MNIIHDLAQLLEIDPDMLQSDAQLDSFENWDSLTKVSLVALVQEKIGRVIEADEIDAFVTVGDLMRYVGFIPETSSR